MPGKYSKDVWRHRTYLCWCQWKKQFFLVAAGAFTLCSPARGQDSSVSHQKTELLEQQTARTLRLAYLLYLPASYNKDPASIWPLILYLHGGSLRGDQVERLREFGLPHLLDVEPDFPCIVVSPQCPAGEIWTDADSIDALLTKISRDYRVDPARVYVLGHSMGGRGALYFAYKMPGRFAAAVSVSPLSPVDAWSKELAKLPVWILHGTTDVIAPIAETTSLATAIEKAGGHLRYDALEGQDHYLLDTCEKPEVLSWLLAQKRDDSPVGPNMPDKVR